MAAIRREPLSPEARRLRARMGGLATSARGHHVTEPGRLAAEQRFREQVLAEAAAAGEQLTPAELERRARALRGLFYARLALASARARRDRAASRGSPRP